VKAPTLGGKNSPEGECREPGYVDPDSPLRTGNFYHFLSTKRLSINDDS